MDMNFFNVGTIVIPIIMFGLIVLLNLYYNGKFSKVTLKIKVEKPLILVNIVNNYIANIGNQVVALHERSMLFLRAANTGVYKTNSDYLASAEKNIDRFSKLTDSND